MLCIITSDDVCVAMNAIDVPSLILMQLQLKTYSLSIGDVYGSFFVLTWIIDRRSVTEENGHCRAAFVTTP